MTSAKLSNISFTVPSLQVKDAPVHLLRANQRGGVECVNDRRQRCCAACPHKEGFVILLTREKLVPLVDFILGYQIATMGVGSVAMFILDSLLLSG